MKQSLYSWRFSWKLITDLRFYGIVNFFKNVYDSSDFCKIWAIILNLHTNIVCILITNLWYWISPKSIELWDFFNFLKFAVNFRTCANFDLLSSNFIRKCTNTKESCILSLVEIGEAYQFQTNLNFLIFVIVTLHFQIWCIRKASFAIKPKSCNVLPQRKKKHFVKTRFTSFSLSSEKLQIFMWILKNLWICLKQKRIGWPIIYLPIC